VKGCPAGTFKSTNSFECVPCEVGTYSLGGYPYPTKCEPCPDGRTTIGKGAYNQEQCGECDSPSREAPSWFKAKQHPAVLTIMVPEALVNHNLMQCVAAPD